MPDPRQQDYSLGESGLILLIKLIILTINIYLFPHQLKLGKSLQTCCFNFYIAYIDILRTSDSRAKLS